MRIRIVDGDARTEAIDGQIDALAAYVLGGGIFSGT